VKEGTVTIYPRNLRGFADSDSWPSGTAVELTAVSELDWEFDCWGKYKPGYPDPIPMSYKNTITIMVDENMSIAAHFICRG